MDDKVPNFLFGINPVLEKLRTLPHDLCEVLIDKTSSAPALRNVETQARRVGIPLKYVLPDLLDRFSGGQRHQGVVAKVLAYSYLRFSDLLEAMPAFSEWVWILILDGLTDPRNFGALLRTAESVGIRHILIPKDRAVAVTPTVVAASAGAIYYLNIYRVTNLRRAIADLKQLGFWIVGLDANAQEGIYDRTYPKRLGIVLGSEGTGIRSLIQRECDYLAAIPMQGRVSSLNVTIAGAVFLYELLRQVSYNRVDKGSTKR
ncbi:MAG: 23S rRNA (guanosine(2251)-2'-O)-methyltransferase RlmB [Candidatus Binatia bacterium]